MLCAPALASMLESCCELLQPIGNTKPLCSLVMAVNRATDSSTAMFFFSAQVAWPCVAIWILPNTTPWSCDCRRRFFPQKTALWEQWMLSMFIDFRVPHAPCDLIMCLPQAFFVRKSTLGVWSRYIMLTDFRAPLQKINRWSLLK